MQKLITLAPFALIACAPEIDETKPQDQAETVEPTNMSVAGMTFEVEGEQGVARTVFGTDGTYVDYGPDGNESGSGTYEERDDGKLCFAPDDGGDAVDCWTMEGPPDDEGWATSVRERDGLRVKARPVTE